MKTIKGLLLAGFIGLSGLLAGCGGGGAGGSTTPPTTTTTISGTAATGAAMAGATVTVKDAKGITVGSATAAANGTFTLTVTTPANYTAPFMLQADPTPGAASSGDEHYGFLLTLDAVTAANNHVNITPVTSLILFEATKTNLATVFSTLTLYKDLTDAELLQARSNVVVKFPVLAGLTNQDFFGQTFSANGTDVYDAAMDTIDLVKIEFSGNTPTLKNSTDAVVAYDATTPLYPIASVTLAAGSAQQVADSASYNLITATVANNQGAPAKGVKINFSTTAGTIHANNNALPNLEITSAITDTTGIARVYLKAGTNIGSATVIAESSDNATSGTTSVAFVPGAPDTIGVSAAPAELAPGGSTTLTVSVLDANSNPVSDGQSITFTIAKAGGAQGGSFGGFNTVTRSTINGLISLSYTAGATAGIETIAATATNSKSGVKVLTIAAIPSSVASVTLVSANATIPAGGSTTTLSATARDGSNNPVVGVTIAFTNAGGTLLAASAVTNASGVASVTLTSGAAVQTARVTASINGFSANADVGFTAGAAAVLGINAAPNQVKPGGTSQITVSVVDGSGGNPVPNAPVSLTFSQKGSGSPSLNAIVGTTNAQGLVVVTYTAGANKGADKIHVVSGVLSNATDASIDVDANYAVVGSVTMSSASSSIAVGSPSGASTLIRATIRDIANQPIAGYTVTFATSAGSLFDAAGTNPASTAVTDVNGIATVTLKAGSTRLTALVSASAGGFTGNTSVNFVAGAADEVTMSAAPTTVRPGGTSNIYAYVTDAHRNPVVGEIVTFSFADRKSGQPGLSSATAVTNQNGLASVVYTAGASANTHPDKLQATTSNSKQATSPLEIIVSNSTPIVSNVTLTAGSTTLQADGSKITLRATVLDTTGAAAVGIGVTFTTSGGTLLGSDGTALTNPVTTDSNGYAEVQLESPGRVGTVTVIVNASGFLASQDITITAGLPNVDKFAIFASPTQVNAGGTSLLTAIVLDAQDNPVQGQTVTFAFKVGENKSGGSITPFTAVTSPAGIATATYTGGNAIDKTDTVTATLVSGDTKEATIMVTGRSVNALSIGTSRTTVKSDNSEIAVITVTALSSQNVVVPGVTISFTANGGQLSASQVVTNASGQASVNLTPGTLDKSNRTVTVSATAAGVAAVLIPVRVVDSTVTLTTTSTTLTAGGANATVTVTARDASGLGIYNVPVTLSQSGAGTLIIVAASGNTDVNGQFTTTVSGSNPGSATLSATALGATATQTYTVLPGTTFAITAPATDPVSMSTGGTLVFTVNAPTQTNVRFATTIGTWSVCPGGVAGTNVCTASVAAGTSTATLTSAAAGIASVQVDGLDGGGSVTGTDGHTVAITSAVAASVTLQASAANVQPSTGGALNTVTLIATLRDASGQPVGNVPVAFSLVNTTGGGETLSPVIKLSSDGVASTDPLGQARTTFTSGSLPSGQASASIQIKATAVGSAATPATVNIVIGGTAGSVVIGLPSHFTDNTERTAYIVPMAVQVADSNGNPVPGGTVVSLSVWPTDYSQGVWVSGGGGTDCSPSYSGGSPHANEDANENLILDAGEDEAPKLDGSLTPGNSTGGTLPSTVVTDASGLVNFNFVYLKQYAAWIDVRVRATALVQGTEATGNLLFTLPWLKVDSDACVLPNSPFN